MTEQIRSILQDGLDEVDPALSAPDNTVDTLTALARLVSSWGARINLTGHQDAEAIARRLVLDAAALLYALPPFESLADLGSGAGFPGLPAAILEPERRIILVESRERRHHFQRHAIRELGLTNVEALRGRFEDLEPIRCSAVVAQAVATPDRLVAAMLRWAAPGAILAVPGGTQPRSARTSEGMKSSQISTYEVPCAGPTRTLWTARAL